MDKEFDLADYAGQVNNLLEGCKEKFMLVEPMTLTVKKSDGTYSKLAHIGGEMFIPSYCYLGKRKQLIFGFKPAQISQYQSVEMEESLAESAFTMFGPFVVSLNADLSIMREQAAKNDALEEERKKMQKHAQTYDALGFGSW